MDFIDKTALAQRAPYRALIAALASGLQQPIESPPRSHYAPNHDDSAVLNWLNWPRSRNFPGAMAIKTLRSSSRLVSRHSI